MYTQHPQASFLTHVLLPFLNKFEMHPLPPYNFPQQSYDPLALPCAAPSLMETLALPLIVCVYQSQLSQILLLEWSRQLHSLLD